MPSEVKIKVSADISDAVSKVNSLSGALSRAAQGARESPSPQGAAGVASVMDARSSYVMDALKAVDSVQRSAEKMFRVGGFGALPAEAKSILKSQLDALLSVRDALEKNIAKGGFSGGMEQAVDLRGMTREFQSSLDAAAEKGKSPLAKMLSADRIVATALSAAQNEVSAFWRERDKTGIISAAGQGDFMGAWAEMAQREADKKSARGGLAGAAAGGSLAMVGLIPGLQWLAPILGMAGSQIGKFAGENIAGAKERLAATDAMNRAAYAGLWRGESSAAIQSGSLYGRRDLRGFWREQADVGAARGFSSGESLALVQELARHGLSSSEALRGAGAVFEAERATGADRGVLADAYGRFARYGDGNALAAARGGMAATGMTRGQMPEFLQALSRILDASIEKGVAKSAEEGAKQLAFVSALGGGKAEYSGASGASKALSRDEILSQASSNMSSADDMLMADATLSAMERDRGRSTGAEFEKKWGVSAKTYDKDPFFAAQAAMQNGVSSKIFGDYFARQMAARGGGMQTMSFALQKYLGGTLGEANSLYDRVMEHWDEFSRGEDGRMLPWDKIAENIQNFFEASSVSAANGAAANAEDAKAIEETPEVIAMKSLTAALNGLKQAAQPLFDANIIETQSHVADVMREIAGLLPKAQGEAKQPALPGGEPSELVDVGGRKIPSDPARRSVGHDIALARDYARLVEEMGEEEAKKTPVGRAFAGGDPNIQFDVATNDFFSAALHDGWAKKSLWEKFQAAGAERQLEFYNLAGRLTEEQKEDINRNDYFQQKDNRWKSKDFEEILSLLRDLVESSGAAASALKKTAEQ